MQEYDCDNCQDRGYLLCVTKSEYFIQKCDTCDKCKNDSEACFMVFMDATDKED